MLNGMKKQHWKSSGTSDTIFAHQSTKKNCLWSQTRSQTRVLEYYLAVAPRVNVLFWSQCAHLLTTIQMSRIAHSHVVQQQDRILEPQNVHHNNVHLLTGGLCNSILCNSHYCSREISPFQLLLPCHISKTIDCSIDKESRTVNMQTSWQRMWWAVEKKGISL
jgi:hypothetical protein